MRSRSLVLIGSAAACLAVLLGLSAGPAFATDPSPTPPQASIVGVGSDTAQDVMEKVGTTPARSGYSRNYNATTSTFQLWGYDATGSASIVTKIGCPAITRPNGSGSGIAALKADEAAGRGCIDFARSSRVKNTATDGDLLFVPYARDGVTWATFPSAPGSTSFHAPVNLTTAQLNAIYSCTVTRWNQVGGGNFPIVAYLPQASSGTRSFFLTAIGVTTPGACVKQPTTLEENNGTLIPAADRPNTVLPFSTAKWIAQKNTVSTDVRAGATLRQINGTAPLTATGTLNTGFSPTYLRLIFNVIKPADRAKTQFSKIFARTGYICTHPSIATTFGFAALPTAQCGY
jgi:ABC-type phosphate transport system substrate-binding protein